MTPADLAELLKTASDVTGILSERSQQVNSLILNANDLLAVLVERRQVSPFPTHRGLPLCRSNRL